MPQDKLTLTSAHYLGGHPDRSRNKTGNLILTEDAIGVGVLAPKHGAVPWSNVASVEVTSEQQAKSRGGAALAFGVGALAAKSSTNKATVIVRTKDGHQVYFQLDNKDAAHVRSKISTRLVALGVPFFEDAPSAASASAPAAGGDVVGQLERLAALRDAGHLSDEEFAAQKARLLVQ